MSDPFDPELTEITQPQPEDVSFDLASVLSSVVYIRTKISTDAFTASSLGGERAGHGVVIRDDGLVLTIGYLITEAQSVWLIHGEGKATEGHVVGYDRETGFGLVQAFGPLGLPAMEIGDSASLGEGDPVIVAGYGGPTSAINAQVIAKREFAGYWEYVLDEGIFTAPPHPVWGGAALIGEDGRLLGIGSLFIQQAFPDEEPMNGNLIVPIDLLKPILDDLVKFGRANKPSRPWLGMSTMDSEGGLMIAKVADGGPANSADVRAGDVVLEIDGDPVDQLAPMYRKIWALGVAGVEVPLTVLREGEEMEIRVRSGSRADYLKSPRLH